MRSIDREPSLVSRAGSPMVVLVSLLAAALVGNVAESEAGAEEGQPVSVLGIQAIDAPEALATRLTKALRQAVRERADLVLRPGKDVIELRFVFGCEDEITLGPCLAQAGDSLGVDHLVLGIIHGKQASGKVQVTLDLLDVPSRAIVKGVNANVDPIELSTQAIPFNAERWLGMLLPKPPSAAVSEPTPVPEPGRHETVTTRPVPAAATAKAAKAKAAPTDEKPLTTDEKIRLFTIGGGIAIGVALILSGAAIGAAIASSDGRSNAHDTLLLVAHDDPGYTGANAAWFRQPTCDFPGLGPASTHAADYTSQCHGAGGLYGASVGLGVAAAIAGLGGVALVVVPRYTLPQPAATPAATTPVTSLVPTVTPIFGPNLAGLSATLRF